MHEIYSNGQLLGYAGIRRTNTYNFFVNTVEFIPYYIIGDYANITLDLMFGLSKEGKKFTIIKNGSKKSKALTKLEAKAKVEYYKILGQMIDDLGAWGYKEITLKGH